MLTPEERNITYLILCTVSGVAAGLQVQAVTGAVLEQKLFMFTSNLVFT